MTILKRREVESFLPKRVRDTDSWLVNLAKFILASQQESVRINVGLALQNSMIIWTPSPTNKFAAVAIF